MADLENPKSCAFFTKQFQKAKFGLKYEPSFYLGTAQCARYHRAYIVYRALWAAYWVSVLIYDVSDADSSWCIYLTSWSYLMLTISSLLQLICSIHFEYFKFKLVPEETPIFYKINWVVYNFSADAAILVTLMYWLTLYEGQTLTFENLAVHLFNSVYVLIDVWITGVPVRILHFWHTNLYGIVYLIFSLIHWAAGGAPIYPILDYENDPATAAICIVGLSFVGVPLFHMIMFCLYWLRVLLYGVCCSPITGSVKISADLEGNGQKTGMDEGHENSAYRLESGHI